VWLVGTGESGTEAETDRRLGGRRSNRRPEVLREWRCEFSSRAHMSAPFVETRPRFCQQNRVGAEPRGVVALTGFLGVEILGRPIPRPEKHATSRDFCGRWIERMDGMHRTGTGLFSKKSLTFFGIV
jgi:hypothetical protein